MNPQIITTDGEELVVLPRRDYDVLLARLRDEGAEDRMTVRLVEESWRRIASGEEGFVQADASGRPVLGGPDSFDVIILHLMRKAWKISQQELAEAAGITRGYLSDIEAQRKTPTADVLTVLVRAMERLRPNG
jgi:hypothetical protein